MTTSADDLCIRSLSMVGETAGSQMITPSLSARDSLKRVDKQGLLYSQSSAVFANILFSCKSEHVLERMFTFLGFQHVRIPAF